jgi:hypothetical protein
VEPTAAVHTRPKSYGFVVIRVRQGSR